MSMKRLYSVAALFTTVFAAAGSAYADTTTTTSAAVTTGANPFVTMVAPIIVLLNQILGPAIALVGALGAIYCVILGVKLAKAEEQQDREKAKSSLKNAIIGFLLIFILVVALKVGIGPLSDWMNGFSK